MLHRKGYMQLYLISSELSFESWMVTQQMQMCLAWALKIMVKK